MQVTFRHYKHSQGKQPTLYIQCCKHKIDQCPVLALSAYFALRKPDSGALFTFMDGSPLSRGFFSQQLNLSLIWAGCQSKYYKGHSFRIGAATSAVAAGIPEAHIKLMGRWSSDAYKKYIRIPVLNG